MNKQITLQKTEAPAIIKSTQLPVFKAELSTDLLCPGCARIVGAGVTFDRLKQLGFVDTVIECPCGTRSHLP